MRASILVVEDDEDLRDLLRLLLEDAGYAVDTAENGVDAFVRLYFRRAPDLVLLNLWLPVVPGADVLDVVRHDDEMADMPVVVITGARVPAEVRLAANAVVPKPFGPDELMRVVELMAPHHAGASPPP